MDKPLHDSLPRGTWYASARTIRASGYNLNFSSNTRGDRNQAYEAMIYRGQSYRHLCWAAGILGYYGRYQLGNQHDSVLVDQYLAKRPYFGGGGKVSVAWNLPLNQEVDFRPLGMDVTLNRESGPYLTFVQQLQERFSSVTVEEDPWSVNVGITSGLRLQTAGGMILGYHALVMIPDQDYQRLYRYYDIDRKEKRSFFGGAHITMFGGLDHFLLTGQFGVGEAQLYGALGLQYRFNP